MAIGQLSLLYWFDFFYWFNHEHATFGNGRCYRNVFRVAATDLKQKSEFIQYTDLYNIL